MRPGPAPPTTPDGRYLVSNPALGTTQRALLVEALMHARRETLDACGACDHEPSVLSRSRLATRGFIEGNPP
jgi:hypothetical protein